MSGYGRDESAPTPDGMFAPHFVGVSCVFRWCSQRFGNPFAALWQSVSSRRGPIYRAHVYVFAMHWQSLRNTFTECSQRVSYLYVTYSLCKKGLFVLQKYGFCRAKTPFLHCKSMVFEMQYTKQRTRNNEVWYYI